MLGISLALLGFILIFITKQGYSLNPFNRPKQHTIVRLAAFVGLILIVFGILAFLNEDISTSGSDVIGYVVVIAIIGIGAYFVQLRIRGKTHYRIFDPYVLRIALLILVGILTYVFVKAFFGV